MGSFRKFSQIAAIIAAGGVASRWHGGGIFQTAPKVIKNTVWALPFALTVYFAAYNIWFSLCAFVLCLAGKATGHGGFMDLGTNPKEPFNGRTPEKLEWLILWLYPHMPRYWYDALGMCLMGLAATSGAAMVFWYIGDHNAAYAFTVAGLAKGPCYMLGRFISTKYATELGEFFTGLAAFAAIAYTLVKYNILPI